jgi:hypothetical protein
MGKTPRVYAPPNCGLRRRQTLPKNIVRGMIVRGIGKSDCKIIPLKIIPLTPSGLLMLRRFSLGYCVMNLDAL